FPDRTEAILTNDDHLLLSRFNDALRALVQLGATRIVLACFTLHHFLASVPDDLKRTILPLTDIALDEVIGRGTSSLLLCTTGTRRALVFQRNERWKPAERFVVLPHDDDQGRIHDLIYRIKAHADPRPLIPELCQLLERYPVESFVAGCTELHILTKLLVND